MKPNGSVMEYLLSNKPYLSTDLGDEAKVPVEISESVQKKGKYVCI